MSWQYRLHQKRPGSVLHSWENPDSTALWAQQISRHALEETVPKCGVTGNQRNILVRTKLLNPHPWLATLQANCLETKFVAYSCSYYPTVTTQSVYTRPENESSPANELCATDETDPWDSGSERGPSRANEHWATVMTQSVYNEPKMSPYPSYKYCSFEHWHTFDTLASSPGIFCLQFYRLQLVGKTWEWDYCYVRP